MQSEIFGPLGSEKYLDYTDSILKSAEHLHAIINDVLDVSAIEAGALNMLEEPVDFSVVVSAALRMVSSRAETVGVTLINNIDSGIPKVFGDERRFKQVIVNLLANSIRFTPENGSIELSWNCPKSGGLNIYVKDTGIGMDEDGIAKALSVFGQVESDMARKFDGTGLGLPLSKSLIEAHDGTLSIESTLNEGTIINISIPPTRIIS
jgi:signal transduction histidine kinase